MEKIRYIGNRSDLFPSPTNPIIDKEATTVETVDQTHSSPFRGHSLRILSDRLWSRRAPLLIQPFVFPIRIGFRGWNRAVHYRQSGRRQHGTVSVFCRNRRFLLYGFCDGFVIQSSRSFRSKAHEFLHWNKTALFSGRYDRYHHQASPVF